MDSSHWLTEVGENARLIRAKDWTPTSLGELGSWPAPLRVTVNMMLEGGGPIAIAWGPDYRMLYNDAYVEIVGDRHPHSLGLPCAEIFPEAWDHVRPLFEQVYRGESVAQQDVPFAIKRGGEIQTHFFTLSYSPIRGVSGKVEGLFAVVVESTTRIAAEEDKSRAFETTMSTIEDFVYSFDQEGRFLYANRALLELLELNLEQTVGKKFSDLPYPPDLARKLEQQLAECISTRRTVRDETAYTSPSGRYGEYEYIFSPVISKTGRVFSVVGTTREITLRRQQEQSLREAHEQLESRVKERTAQLSETLSELEAFSYTVSHDMRAPLRVIHGYSQMLLEEHAEQLDQPSRDYLQKILRSTDRLNLLITDVLAYTRVSNEKISLSPVSLQSVLEEVMDEQPALINGEAEIEIENTLPAVLAHEVYLSQIFSNLIGNAIKYVPPNERPKVRVWTKTVDDTVEINVADNGVGIDPRHHHQIFEIFGRVNPDKTYPGTGIGLSIVKKAVQRMGGTIGLESSPGRGSRFYFTLKTAEPALDAAPPSEEIKENKSLESVQGSPT